MNLRNIMKERVLAMADPDDQPAVRRFALDLRKQIKLRNIKETPFLVIRIHAASVAFVRMLRMERELMSPDASDETYDRWQKAADALQKVTDQFEKALERSLDRDKGSIEKIATDISEAILQPAETAPTECPKANSPTPREQRSPRIPPPGIVEPAFHGEPTVIEAYSQSIDADAILARAREELDLFGVLPRVLETCAA